MSSTCQKHQGTSADGPRVKQNPISQMAPSPAKNWGGILRSRALAPPRQRVGSGWWVGLMQSPQVAHRQHLKPSITVGHSWGTRLKRKIHQPSKFLDSDGSQCPRITSFPSPAGLIVSGNATHTHTHTPTGHAQIRTQHSKLLGEVYAQEANKHAEDHLHLCSRKLLVMSPAQ